MELKKRHVAALYGRSERAGQSCGGFVHRRLDYKWVCGFFQGGSPENIERCADCILHIQDAFKKYSETALGELEIYDDYYSGKRMGCAKGRSNTVFKNT